MAPASKRAKAAAAKAAPAPAASTEAETNVTQHASPPAVNEKAEISAASQPAQPPKQRGLQAFFGAPKPIASATTAPAASSAAEASAAPTALPNTLEAGTEAQAAGTGVPAGVASSAPSASKRAASPPADNGAKKKRGGSKAAAKAPAKAPAKACDKGGTEAPTASPEKAPERDLSTDQLNMIEENRRKAMLKKQGASPPPKESVAATLFEPPTTPPTAADTATAGKSQTPSMFLKKGASSTPKAAKEPAAATASPTPKATHAMFLKKGASPTPKATKDAVASCAASPAARTQTPRTVEETPPKVQLPSVDGKSRIVSTVPVGKFAKLTCNDWMQYHKIYTVRLSQLRGAVLQQARALWGASVPPQAFLSDITGYRKCGGSDVVIIGVVFKAMKSRRNIVEDYRQTKDTCVLPEQSAEELAKNLCSEGDAISLEDSAMRLDLVMPPEQVKRLFTGLVVGVRGSATPEGTFKVNAMCFPRAPSPLALINIREAPAQFVAFMSGLAFGSNDEGLAEARDRAADLLTSQSVGPVSRVLVCGGTYTSPKTSQGAIDSADTFLAQLAEKIPVEVLPGRTDPTNLTLPQMAIHPFFFKTARGLPGDKFRCVSNPYDCTLDGVSLLGHSGQPVDDVMRCSDIADPVQALSLMLESRHLAPTAPDTLETQPFAASDPFVLDSLPHVLFSGGHATEGHMWCPNGDGGTMCICVPAFETTRKVVLVNLRNPRDVRVETFHAALPVAAKELAGPEPVDVAAGGVPVAVN